MYVLVSSSTSLVNAGLTLTNTCTASFLLSAPLLTLDAPPGDVRYYYYSLFSFFLMRNSS
jgi:hypothetical protein